MVRLVRTPSPAIVKRIVGLPEAVRLLVEISGAEVADINRVRDLISSVADVETSFVLSQDKVSA